MATFLSQAPPQPGDGRYLTQVINHNVRNGRQRGPYDHSQTLSFLPQNARPVHGEDVAQPSHFGRHVATFHDTRGNIDPGTDNTRETPHDSFLAPPAAAAFHACDTPDEYKSFLQHPQSLHQQSIYTKPTVLEPELDDVPMPVKTIIPPHARSKHDSVSGSRSTPEKTPPTNASLRERLSALGATVSDPKPLPTERTTTFEDLLPSRDIVLDKSARHGQDDRGRGRGRGGGRGRGRNRGSLPDSFVSAQSNAKAFAGNSDGVDLHSANRGRGGGNATTRDSRWPSRKDFPQPPPERHQISWERHSWDSTTIDSGRASSGWGTRQKKRDARQAGVPLTGYDGKLAPPPVDWDNRPGFRDGQSYEQIMQWMAGIESLLCGITRSVATEDVTTEDGITYVFSMMKDTQDETVKQMGEIAPTHWMPITLGRKAPGTFWAEIVASDEPPPCDMNDLAEAQPWWNRRIENQSFLRDPQALPEIGVDPDDEDAEQRLRRRHDLGSLTHAENRRALELDRKETKLARQKKADAKHQRLAAMADNLDHLRISTGVKLFVRAARKEDMEAIANIYNFYILNTTSTPEIDPRTKDQMHQRWKDTRLNRMPYLVACEKGGVIKARANNKKSKRNMRGGDEDIVLPDVVIGFAFADDFNDLKGMYRFTAEMEVYVHTDYYMKGVGKCLLDKLMGLLDSHYLERGGYEVVGEDMDGTGQARVVKNIVVHLSYDKPEKLEWIGKWLEGWLQFRRVGVLDGIGTKNGKAVSMAIFQRETGEPLDHANPPIMMEYPTSVA